MSSDNDSDSTYIDSGSDSGSEYDSFSSVQADLERMSAIINELNIGVHDLEAHMTTLHRPMESLHLDQLGDVPFLASSPFRHQTFAVKPPGIPGIDLERRYAFHTICAALRNYCIALGANSATHDIELPKLLQNLFGITNGSYMDMLMNLRRVIM